MKKLLPCLFLLAVLASGCARHYQITLQNGNRITTTGKPKLENGWYVFKDMHGMTNAVSQGSVREVAPRPGGYSDDSGPKRSGRR